MVAVTFNLKQFANKITRPTFTVLLAKQRYISSFLLCLFALMFAHSIVPHQHHEEDSATHQSDHHDGDDHDDFDTNFLQKAFFNVQHASNSSNTCQTTTSTSPQYSKFVADEDAVVFAQYVLKQFFRPPIIHQAHITFAFKSTQFSASNLFRGPPSA